MDRIATKYSAYRRLVHKFQARRDIPFRKKFFVGYDLHGNTYWEFSLDGNMSRLRRKLEPYQEAIFEADYFATVPPPWLQWLRRTKKDPPTLQELVNEQTRQQQIKILAQEADRRWTMEKERLEHNQRLKLHAELDKVKEENARFKAEQEQQDPWKEAAKKENPIESAFIKPRK